jgi:hypothetical protein
MVRLNNNLHLIYILGSPRRYKSQSALAMLQLFSPLAKDAWSTPALIFALPVLGIASATVLDYLRQLVRRLKAGSSQD